MLDVIKDLLSNRRGYAFLIPLLVIAAQRLGIVTTDDQMGTLLDQVAAAASGVLALWSLRRPKQTGLLIALIALSFAAPQLAGCASSPTEQLVAATNLAAAAGEAATAEIARRCPDSALSDPAVGAACLQLATDNATAQKSLAAAVHTADAVLANSESDKPALDQALADVTAAFCNVQRLVPNVKLAADAPPCQ